MNQTFYQLNMLNSTSGLIVALLIGMAFGVCLEIGGFGSSKILSGIFYLRDLRVLKVMMSAMLTAILGLLLLEKVGVIRPGMLHILPTFYLAAVIGGLLFGVGFAAGGWCPGTAAVGVASGKIDAWVFILGNMVGVVAFAWVYQWFKVVYTIGDVGEVSLLELADQRIVALVAVLGGIVVLGIAESWNTQYRYCQYNKILQNRGWCLVTVGWLALWLIYCIWPVGEVETSRLALIEQGEDHVECIDVADAMMNNAENYVVVDVRSKEEYSLGHIPGAVNIALPELADKLNDYRQVEKIILYSNGMTHPAQARELLSQQGYENIYILSGGYEEFISTIAKPLSLRIAPVTSEDQARYNWYIENRN